VTQSGGIASNSITADTERERFILEPVPLPEGPKWFIKTHHQDMYIRWDGTKLIADRKQPGADETLFDIDAKA